MITDPATGTLYAANFTDSTVSVINPARCNAARTQGCRHPAPTAKVGARPGRARRGPGHQHRIRRQQWQ